MNKKITMSCGDEDKKATYVIEGNKYDSNILLISEAVTKLYQLLSTECQVPVSLIDEFLKEVSKPFNIEDLGLEPQFKNIDDFTTKLNEDEGFRNFLFDLFKESFYEKV